MRAGMREQHGPWLAKQRAPPARPPGHARPLLRHGGGTGHPGPPQEVQEHRLGLVAAMLRQRYPVGPAGRECGIAQPARSAFQTFTRLPRHLNAAELKRHLPRLAQCGAKLRPGVGVRAQTMMDVQRGERERMRVGITHAAQGMQENDRIEAAGKADAQAHGAPLNRRQGGQRAPQGLDDRRVDGASWRLSWRQPAFR